MSGQNDSVGTWWKRRILRLPVWVWLVAVVVVIAAVAGVGGQQGGDNGSADAPTAQQPVDSAAPTGLNADSAALPDVQARDCPAVDAALISVVEAELDDGLVLRVATSASDDEGREWLLASVYRLSDLERVSSADTWVQVDDAVYAVSSSANEYSGMPDGRDVAGVDFDNRTRTDLESCAIAALRPPGDG